MEVGITWGVIFGKGDSTDPFSDTVELTEEEAQLYKQAFRDEISPNDVEGLRGALRRAYDRIEEEQIQIGIEEGYEYALECQARGVSPYDHGWKLKVEFDDCFDWEE